MLNQKSRCRSLGKHSILRILYLKSQVHHPHCIRFVTHIHASYCSRHRLCIRSNQQVRLRIFQGGCLHIINFRFSISSPSSTHNILAWLIPSGCFYPSVQKLPSFHRQQKHSRNRRDHSCSSSWTRSLSKFTYLYLHKLFLYSRNPFCHRLHKSKPSIQFHACYSDHRLHNQAPTNRILLCP